MKNPMKNFLSDKIFIDLETYSKLDIRRVGSYVYASHPSTFIVCAALVSDKGYKLFSGTPKSLFLFRNVIKHHVWSGGKIYAHNAMFEYLVLSKYIPNLSIESFYCTSHLSAFRGGCASLRNACDFWRLEKKKWDKGSSLIREYHQIMKDVGSLKAYYKSDSFKDLLNYCLIDTQSTKELYEKIVSLRGDMTKEEYQYWLDTHKLNSLGLPVNVKKANTMLKAHEDFGVKVKKKFLEVYGFNPNSPKQINEWLGNRGQKITVVKRDKRTNKYEQKDTVEVPAVNQHWKNLTKEVKQMFNFKWCFPSAQVKRLARVDEIEVDGRMRGLLHHFGAITGRYTSKGFNILNFPKSSKTIFNETDTLQTHKWETGKVLLGSLRSVVESKDKVLIVSDLSQIEFRLLMWFCERQDILDKLNKGHDIYLDFAEDLFKFRPKKDSLERHISKTGTLQLGYGSRPGRFTATLSKEIKNASLEIGRKSYNVYHRRYPEVIKLHKKIKDFLDKGEEFRGKRFSLIDDYILLPSGRKFYVRDIDANSKNKYSYYDGKTPLIVPEHMAVSWLCQGTARDIISLKQNEALKAGLKVLFNEYDKVVIESTKEKSKENALILADIMKKSVDFLPNLMVNSDTEIVKHYK